MPQRIYEAKRASLRGWMVATWHVREGVADSALDAWNAEATTRGIERADSRYWSEAEPWLRDKAAVSGERP